MEEQPLLALHPAYRDHADTDFHQALDYLVLTGDVKKNRAVRHRELFPVKLHTVLETCSVSMRLSLVMRWLPHGRAFKIYNKDQFVKEILPRYFPSQQVFASFQRQLIMYGFLKLTGAHIDNGAYYHPLLLRGRPLLSQLLVRPAEAESAIRRRFDPRSEPAFYYMPPVYSRALPSHANKVATLSNERQSFTGDSSSSAAASITTDDESRVSISPSDGTCFTDSLVPRHTEELSACSQASPSTHNALVLPMFSNTSTDGDATSRNDFVNAPAWEVTQYEAKPARFESPQNRPEPPPCTVCRDDATLTAISDTAGSIKMQHHHELNPRDAVRAVHDYKDTINNMGIPMLVEDAVAACDCELYADLF